MFPVQKHVEQDQLGRLLCTAILGCAINLGWTLGLQLWVSLSCLR